LVSKSVILILEGAAWDETNIYFPWDSTGLCVGEKSIFSSRDGEKSERDLFAAGRKLRGASWSTSLFHKRIFMYREAGARSVLQIKKFSHLIPLSNETSSEEAISSLFAFNRKKRESWHAAPVLLFLLFVNLLLPKRKNNIIPALNKTILDRSG
jgi:hypothetical protein